MAHAITENGEVNISVRKIYAGMPGKIRKKGKSCTRQTQVRERKRRRE